MHASFSTPAVPSGPQQQRKVSNGHAGKAKAGKKAPLDMLTSLESIDVESCAPETQEMIRALMAMALQTPEWLTRALFQSLFGTPDAATDIVRMWCRSMQRAQMQESLGPLLSFLATAPAIPCVQHHRVGGRERHAVYFLPFGQASRMAQTLRIPLVAMDVRVTRAVQLLTADPWAFGHTPQDPVFGFYTYSSFSYTKEAQKKLDECRPLLLAAAVRAMVIQLRLDISNATSSSSSKPTMNGVLPRARMEAAILAKPPTYTQTVIETDLLEIVQQQIRAIQLRRRARLSPLQRNLDNLSFRLLQDALSFVLTENTQSVTTATAGGDVISITGVRRSHDLKHTVSMIPTDEQVFAFATQTTQNWIRALGQARIVLPVSDT